MENGAGRGKRVTKKDSTLHVAEQGGTDANKARIETHLLHFPEEGAVVNGVKRFGNVNEGH